MGKQLTEAYGTISKDLVHEKKVASYVLNLLKQKISKLKKFLAAAKLDAEMMVRCGVTKESCETYHFKNKAFPENVVPVDPTGKGNSKEWAAMGPTKGKKGDPSVVDIRNTNDLKSDGTLRVGAL